ATTAQGRGISFVSQSLKVTMFNIKHLNNFGGINMALVRVLLVMLAFGLVAIVPAQKSSRMQDAARHCGQASEAFSDVMNIKDQAIPKELLDRAEAIAVFPGVVKAAFIVGGRGGQGVISRRVKGGWSAPAFFNLSGGSFGLQVG